MADKLVIVESPAKANTINVNGILESIKKSSGNEFKMAVQNKNQKLA